MLITVSGPPGCGTSTTAAGLADVFGLDHVSGGDVFRELAAERGYTLGEFNELAEEDDSIDRDLDRRLYETARERDGLVLESRLSGWLAADEADFRVWLDASLAVRADRIADREGISPEQAHEETVVREASEAGRYREYYGIEITDLSIYDLVIDTARWDPEGVLGLVVCAVERYDSDADEGASPVEGVSYDF